MQFCRNSRKTRPLQSEKTQRGVKYLNTNDIALRCFACFVASMCLIAQWNPSNALFLETACKAVLLSVNCFRRARTDGMRAVGGLVTCLAAHFARACEFFLRYTEIPTVFVRHFLYSLLAVLVMPD